jgi:hypothetical protein
MWLAGIAVHVDAKLIQGGPIIVFYQVLKRLLLQRVRESSWVEFHYRGAKDTPKMDKRDSPLRALSTFRKVK